MKYYYNWDSYSKKLLLANSIYLFKIVVIQHNRFLQFEQVEKSARTAGNNMRLLAFPYHTNRFHKLRINNKLMK